MQAISSSAVLKVSFQGEIRRARLAAQDEVTYDAVIETVSKLFPEVPDYSAKYLDEEGDACTLCPGSFQDFLAVSRAGNAAQGAVPSNKLILKLELVSAPQTAKSFEEESREDLRNLGAGAEAVAALMVMAPMMAPFMAGMKGLFKGKGKGKGKGEGKCHWAAGDGCASQMNQSMQSPMDWAPVMGPMMGMFSGIKGLLKGKGRGKGKCDPMAAAGNNTGVCSFLTPKKVASFLTAMLPEAISHVAGQDMQCLGHTLQGVLSANIGLRSVLESMRQRLQTEGLQHCVDSLEAVLGGDADSMGQFLLSLITGLDVLPFERQIAFFEEFCISWWEKLQEFIGMIEQFVPWAAQILEHPHVVCDGCGADPIKGPRFKCKSCPNYDLCGECFAEKNTVNDGRCADHDFDCIIMPGRGMCGKGMCGKGMWKGKGHCKGKRKADDMEGEDCQGASDESKMEKCTGETMSFPVEVADGRNLQIQWQRGEDPATAAARFAQEHGIKRDELATIIDFIRHAEQITPSAESKADEEMTPAAKSKTDEGPAKDSSRDITKEDASNEPEKIVEQDSACKRQRLEPEKESKAVGFAFPVMLDDGRKLLMEWSSGQDLGEVSRSFAKLHNLPEEAVPQLLDAARRMDPRTSALQQIQEMGFGYDEHVLRELLEACGNDAEKAVEMLTQSM